MNNTTFNAGLCAFLDRSPTPYHAVASMRERLLADGFAALDEGEAWDLAPGGAYLVTRNDSSLIAFRLGRGDVIEAGLRMVGAHTDSPCLRLKPNAPLEQGGYLKFGVEVYGGVLLNPWFDRDLSIAGRVVMRDRRGRLSSTLIDFARPVAVIPSLAIHLDREANDKRSINKQTMLPPLLALAGSAPADIEALVKEELAHRGSPLAQSALVDFELSLYDTQRAALVGLREEFIASARLDNLLSCYTGMEALLGASSELPQLLVCNDHEEVGSGSAAGARGTFLASVIDRIAGSSERRARLMARSMLVSTDNAHGIHPNFMDRHDAAHGPLLNAGPVLKVNANQAYATSSDSAAILKRAARSARVELQSFVTRTDLGCGSTIGPLTATALGVRTVDVGVPTFAMHSIREMAGSADAYALCRVLSAFYAQQDLTVSPG